MARILLPLTSRVMSLLAAGVFFSSCLGQGTDQLHGMYDLSFSSTAVCGAQVKTIPFRNVSGQEIVIEGVAISGGTDPGASFSLDAVRIGEEEIPAAAGFLNEIRIPPGTNYSFVVTYAPREENATHTAILDIAYLEPAQGVIQVTLSGSSAGRVGDCGAGSGNQGPGAGTLTGEMTIRIDRIALATTKVAQAISTDPEQTVVDFIPVEVSIELDAATDFVRLPVIGEEANFRLPPSKIAPLSTLITGTTTLTTEADVTGSYRDDGSVELEGMVVRLQEACFSADCTVTLTTGEIDNPQPFRSGVGLGVLLNAGFQVTADNLKIFGSPVSPVGPESPETFEVILVGVGQFSGVTAGSDCSLLREIEGQIGVVLLEATILP